MSTPSLNAHEVAILGIFRTKKAPSYDGEAFKPLPMLRSSLSYDHRAIDGAEAAGFTPHPSLVLTDTGRVIM